MSRAPAVTVVTPTYKRAGLLAESMVSVQRQTISEWEHIIVDDGPDDLSAKAVQASAAGDPRVRYVIRTGDKAGANVCRNLGVALASSKLVILLDDDDRLRPNCLARRVEVMRRNTDLDFAVFRAETFTNVGGLGALYHAQDPADDLLRFLSLECPWQTTGPIWRRTFLQAIGGFDEDLLSMQDLELHVRALAARARYLCFSEIDHDIRAEIDSERTSTRHFKDPVFLQRSERMPTHLLAVISKANLLTWTRRRALLGLSYGVAESWARIGELTEALRSWHNACHHMKAPLFLRIQGHAMLAVTRAGQRSWNELAARLTNRWKGYARFRQEPALIDFPISRQSPKAQ